MAIETNWYKDHITRPLGHDHVLRRGKELLQDRPGQAALTMARELEMLDLASHRDEISFNTVLGMMQVTAFAIGTWIDTHGKNTEDFPIPEEESSLLYQIYERFKDANNFSPSGNIISDMKKVPFILKGQAPDDLNSQGYGYYQEGINLGISRWQSLTGQLN